MEFYTRSQYHSHDISKDQGRVGEGSVIKENEMHVKILNGKYLLSKFSYHIAHFEQKEFLPRGKGDLFKNSSCDFTHPEKPTKKKISDVIKISSGH